MKNNLKKKSSQLAALSKRPYFWMRTWSFICSLSIEKRTFSFAWQRHFYRFLPTIKSTCITKDEIGNGYCRNRNDYRPIKFEIVSIFLFSRQMWNENDFIHHFFCALVLSSLPTLFFVSFFKHCSDVDSFYMDICFCIEEQSTR